MGELPRSRREPRAKLCLKNWKSTSVAQADFRQNVHTVRYCWMVGNCSELIAKGAPSSGATQNRPYRVTSNPAIRKAWIVVASRVVEKPAAALPWKSLRDSHFPTTSTTTSSYMYVSRTKNYSPVCSRIEEAALTIGSFAAEYYGRFFGDLIWPD